MTYSRKTPKLLRTLVATLVATLLCAAGASSKVLDSQLGKGGRLYTLKAGTYGDIFAVGAGDDQLLALVVSEPGKAVDRLIVPGTEDRYPEYSPSLVYYDGDDRVFVVWETRVNGIHSRLQLISWSPEHGWSDSLVILGSPLTFKHDPQLVATYDSLTSSSGESAEGGRIVLHLAWREEPGRVFYAPIVFTGETFEANQGLFRLDGLFSDLGKDVGDPLALLRVQGGVDGSSAVIGFSDSATGRLQVIDVQVISGAISELAEEIHDFLSDPENDNLDLLTSADQARAHVIHIGRSLNRGLVELVANEASAFLSGQHALQPGAGPLAVADEARAHVIHIGARIDREGLSGITFDGDSALIRLTDEDKSKAHHIRLRLASEHELPEIVADSARLSLSRDGERALLSWETEAGIDYVETDGGFWSEIFTHETPSAEDAATFSELLERRLRP